MRGRIVIVSWLAIVWVALWEQLSWANLIGGVVAASIVLAVVPAHKSAAPYRFRPGATIRLFGFFAWKLVEASALLSWEVVTPRNRINAAVVAVPMRSGSTATLTLVANMVSLIPGTLTLEVDDDPAVLYMHVLHLGTVEAAREEVLRLEELALAAFPHSAEASS